MCAVLPPLLIEEVGLIGLAGGGRLEEVVCRLDSFELVQLESILCVISRI
jgi:hypothetical protein